MPNTTAGTGKPQSETLKVTIRDRRSVMFSGSVKSLSSINSVGEFDVLPEHANFVSLIKDKVILNKDSSNEKIFELDVGLVNVDEVGVNVYVGIGKSYEEGSSDATEQGAPASKERPKKKGFIARKLRYFK